MRHASISSRSDNRKTLLLQQKSNVKSVLEDILLNLSEREIISAKGAEMRSLLSFSNALAGRSWWRERDRPDLHPALIRAMVAMEAGRYTTQRRNHPNISAGRAAHHVRESSIAASTHGVPSVLGAVPIPGTASRDRSSRSGGSHAVAALGAGANIDPRPRVQTQRSIASCRQEACPCARASPASIHPAGVSLRVRETAKRIRDGRTRPFGSGGRREMAVQVSDAPRTLAAESRSNPVSEGPLMCRKCAVLHH